MKSLDANEVPVQTLVNNSCGLSEVDNIMISLCTLCESFFCELLRLCIGQVCCAINIFFSGRFRR